MGTGVSPDRIAARSLGYSQLRACHQLESASLLLAGVIRPTFDGSLLTVESPASGVANSHGVTGGVYKTRERIHRSMLICDY